MHVQKLIGVSIIYSTCFHLNSFQVSFQLHIFHSYIYNTVFLNR
jgi:hypothetical protein